MGAATPSAMSRLSPFRCPITLETSAMLTNAEREALNRTGSFLTVGGRTFDGRQIFRVGFIVGAIIAVSIIAYLAM